MVAVETVTVTKFVVSIFGIYLQVLSLCKVSLALNNREKRYRKSKLPNVLFPTTLRLFAPTVNARSQRSVVCIFLYSYSQMPYSNLKQVYSNSFTKQSNYLDRSNYCNNVYCEVISNTVSASPRWKCGFIPLLPF